MRAGGPLVSAFLAAALAVPTVARAQALPLSEVLPRLLGETIVLLPDERSGQPNHQAHFRPGVDQLEVPGQFNQTLLSLLSTYPLGSPSGGFSYTLDPGLGTFSRNTESFGPVFAERALTIGRGKLSLGFSYQHATYDTFEGNELRQRDTKFYVRHIDCCGRGAQTLSPDGSLLSPSFEGDLVEAALALDLVTDTMVVFANYGVTDRFDLAAAIPFVRVGLDASVLARIERLSTANEPGTHTFEGPDPDQRLFAQSGEAAGLGDIVVRAKYLFVRAAAGGFGAALDVRVPTGDETNLLGTGGVQVKPFLIASFAKGPLAPHVNVGYTFSSEGALPGVTLSDEITSALGFDLTLSPRATLAFDVLSRTLLDAGRMREVEKTLQFTVGGAGTGGGGGGGGGGSGGGVRPDPVQTTVRRELQFQSGNLDLFLGAAGLRFNPWRTLLVSLNLLFPLSEAGLRDRVTPVIGIDFAF